MAYCTLGAAGVLAADLGVVTRFVSYLGAIEYQTRPDLGHWEEQPPEVLTSSLGCCVAGLRAAEALLRRSGDAAGADAAAALSAAGAAALEPRLGGATGGGAWESLKRREDGALTTLLLPQARGGGGGEADGGWLCWAAVAHFLLPFCSYPGQVADLLHLSAGQRQSVAAAVLRLRRPYGVLRYADDRRARREAGSPVVRLSPFPRSRAPPPTHPPFQLLRR